MLYDRFSNPPPQDFILQPTRFLLTFLCSFIFLRRVFGRLLNDMVHGLECGLLFLLAPTISSLAKSFTRHLFEAHGNNHSDFNFLYDRRGKVQKIILCFSPQFSDPFFQHRGYPFHFFLNLLVFPQSTLISLSLALPPFERYRVPDRIKPLATLCQF